MKKLSILLLIILTTITITQAQHLNQIKESIINKQFCLFDQIENKLKEAGLEIDSIFCKKLIIKNMQNIKFTKKIKNHEPTTVNTVSFEKNSELKMKNGNNIKIIAKQFETETRPYVTIAVNIYSNTTKTADTVKIVFQYKPCKGHYCLSFSIIDNKKLKIIKI